jgi:K+-sensing histidine kinase KdpD
VFKSLKERRAKKKVRQKMLDHDKQHSRERPIAERSSLSMSRRRLTPSLQSLKGKDLVANLVENALLHFSESASIPLKTHVVDDQVSVRVIDDGPGILPVDR